MTRKAEYPPVYVTVDVVIFTLAEDEFSVLLVRRGEAPYKGRWALPGGFVRPDEDLDAAAARELHEETGLTPDVSHIEQLKSFGAPKRDPRPDRIVTVAYMALVPDPGIPVGGGDAAEASFWSVDEVLSGAAGKLAFDHLEILEEGVERARSKLEYSPLAVNFCEEPFTIGDLRRVYEAVWGTPLDPANFHRKVVDPKLDFVRPAASKVRRVGPGRPAQLYAKGRADVLHPPLTRP